MRLQTGDDLVALHFNPRDMQEHSRAARTCPGCSTDLGPVAITKLVYSFVVCGCRKEVDYDHLIEQLWHRDCYLSTHGPADADSTERR